MIRASSYGNEAVVAGTPFTLTLTLYATGGQENLNDVVISLTLPDGITMTSGSLSSYLGTMAPQVHPRCQLQPDPPAPALPAAWPTLP